MAELSGQKQAGAGAIAGIQKAGALPGTHSFTEEMTEGVKEAYATVQKKAQEAVVTSEDFIRARPIRTVLGAAAVGFLAGYLARRKQ